MARTGRWVAEVGLGGKKRQRVVLQDASGENGKRNLRLENGEVLRPKVSYILGSGLSHSPVLRAEESRC